MGWYFLKKLLCKAVFRRSKCILHNYWMFSRALALDSNRIDCFTTLPNYDLLQYKPSFVDSKFLTELSGFDPALHWSTFDSLASENCCEFLASENRVNSCWLQNKTPGLAAGENEQNSKPSIFFLNLRLRGLSHLQSYYIIARLMTCLVDFEWGRAVKS